MYKLSKNEYDKLLNDSITSNYKKVNNNIDKVINKNGKELTKKLKVADRMMRNGNNNCFITLKDHKDNFQNNPKVRLINPAKNEVGRISKVILEKINKKLRQHTNVNQWNDTKQVIDWFLEIPEKRKHKFLVFDVKDFYPSISKKIFIEALNFAEQLININNEDLKIMFHSRKSLLFNNEQAWMKKGNELFDVTMGAYDGVEVCELVGIFMLHKICLSYDKKNIGLYRDDGLAVFQNVSGPESEKIKKHFQRIFSEQGLDIIIECNKKIVDYLDVTLNLTNGTFKPYHKPDTTIQYIHKESNHPPNIIKQIPNMIEKRLSDHSSNEYLFYEATPPYEKALKKSGFNVKLKYSPSQNKSSQNKNN